jgi:hypothetical protein
MGTIPRTVKAQKCEVCLDSVTTAFQDTGPVMKDHRKEKPARWMQGIAELARQRGDAENVWQRAVDITQRLNVAPWIGLAVAERRISLAEAAQLERAARCQALQSGVLDKGKTLAEMNTSFPYAPHFLAADLVDALRDLQWTVRDAIPVAEALLAQERQLDDEGRPRPVRRQPLGEYISAARRMWAIMQETGCDAPMAADVELGKVTPDFVRAYMRQKNWFSNPRRRDGVGPDDVVAPPRAPRRAPSSGRFVREARKPEPHA